MLLNSSLSGVAVSGGILPQTADVDEFVANSLRYVIQYIFSNIANTFTVTISARAASPVEFWFHDTMAKLFATWGFMAVQLVVRDKTLSDIRVRGRRFCNMILVDSIDGLVNTRIVEHNRNFDSMEYYFIFLQIRDAWMPPQRAKILQYCLDNYWLHCNVMIQNARAEVLIYTYFPFQESACYQAEPVLINQFDGKKFVNDVMFPNKLGNFHKCPVHVSSWIIPPFIFYGPMESEEQQLFGLEMRILRTLSQKMNFTLQTDAITMNGMQWMENNSSAREAWDKLKYHNTNVTAGFFRRSTERDKAATPSYITYNLPLIPVILRRVDHNKLMSILTFPFDIYTWLILVFSVATMIALNSIRTKYDTKLSNHWHILESLLGITTYRAPRRISRRTVFICWILSSFILRALYQSRLFHLYRTHFYTSPPDSLAEIIERHYTAVCTQNTAQSLKYVPEIRNKSLPVITLNTSNEMEPLNYIEMHMDQTLAAISVLDFVYVYAAKRLKSGNALMAIITVIKNQPINFYFPKHSYFSERFNEWILRFHQAGLLERWRSNSLSSYRISVKSGHSTVLDKQLIIDMKQILRFLVIISTLDVLAIIIFALEMASMRLTILQRIF